MAYTKEKEFVFMADTAARRKRINRLKKIILGSIVLAIIIPVMISVFLGYKVNLLSRNIEELEIRLSEAQSAESQKDCLCGRIAKGSSS